jgi:hypothetical protein
MAMSALIPDLRPALPGGSFLLLRTSACRTLGLRGPRQIGRKSDIEAIAATIRRSRGVDTFEVYRFHQLLGAGFTTIVPLIDLPCTLQ